MYKLGRKVGGVVAKTAKLAMKQMKNVDCIHPCAGGKSSEDLSYFLLDEKDAKSQLSLIYFSEGASDGDDIKKTGSICEEIVKDDPKLDLKEALADAEIRNAKPTATRWEVFQDKAHRMASRCRRHPISSFVRDKIARLRKVFSRKTEGSIVAEE